MTVATLPCGNRVMELLGNSSPLKMNSGGMTTPVVLTNSSTDVLSRLAPCLTETSFAHRCAGIASACPHTCLVTVLDLRRGYVVLLQHVFIQKKYLISCSFTALRRALSSIRPLRGQNFKQKKKHWSLSRRPNRDVSGCSPL